MTQEPATRWAAVGGTAAGRCFRHPATPSAAALRDYYSFGGAVVALKVGVMSSATRTLTYLHGDQLGSASLATSMTGTVLSQQRYAPYGEVRWSSGAGMPTDFTFTGQRAGPPGYVGSLMDYNARFFSPALGRFVSADTIVPGAGNPQAYNRYMYVLGNPLGAIDPSGHRACNDEGDCEDPGTKAVFDPPTYTFPRIVILPVGNTIGYGFGAIENARNNSTYQYTSWLHGGVDLFAAAGTVVRAGVYGKYLGKNRVKDAAYNPANAVVRVGDYYIIYGHVTPNSKLKEGDDVTPDTVLGVVGEWKTEGIRDPSNDHVHLSFLTDPYGSAIAYNPLVFVTPEQADTLLADKQSNYAYGENATSMFSFAYTEANYWTSSASIRNEVIRVVRWRDRLGPRMRAWLEEENK